MIAYGILFIQVTEIQLQRSYKSELESKNIWRNVQIKVYRYN